jgi:predicted amidophosphoribosyltransferase
VAPALRLDGRARDSVGLDAAARAANLRGRLRHVPAGSPPPGHPVVLLDDVLTTGATASACAETLAAAGVSVVAVLTLTAVG